MAYDFIVFGGTGQQGRICSRDLLESGYSVFLAGRDSSRIQGLLHRHKRAGFISVDLRDQRAIVKAIQQSGAKLVVNCAELVFNIAIMRSCLQTKRSCTDLGGLQKVTIEQFKLDAAFKKAGILCLTGCGSTPGIANVMASHAVGKFDTVDTIMLGFAWDSNIKKFVVPYSIQSIFDEFTEAPVIYNNGKFVSSNRMRCQGTFRFKTVGKQTVYCIVHSEVYTFARYFKERGLQDVHYMAGFPQHSLQVIQTLMDLCFSAQKPIEVSGVSLSPLDFTLAVLKRLPIPSGYEEVEDIWVRSSGTKNGKKKEVIMECVVKTVKGWEDAGSNIDTGRTIAVMSEMLLLGLIKEKGVHAPEGAVPHKHFFGELKKRGMHIFENVKKFNH